MKTLNFGLSFEGAHDELPLQFLIEKILEPYDVRIEYKSKLKSDTGIIGFVKIHTAQFKKIPDLHVAVYFTDCDLNNPRRIKTKIKNDIKSVDELFINRSVIATPKRNLEEWILNDFNNVKRYFGLSGEARLQRNTDPKIVINQFIGEMEILKKRNTIYVEILKTADFEKLERDSIEFKNFKRDLLNCIESL